VGGQNGTFLIKARQETLNGLYSAKCGIRCCDPLRLLGQAPRVPLAPAFAHSSHSLRSAKEKGLHPLWRTSGDSPRADLSVGGGMSITSPVAPLAGILLMASPGVIASAGSAFPHSLVKEELNDLSQVLPDDGTKESNIALTSV